MKQYISGELQKPRTDEKQLWDIYSGNFAYKTLLVAHDLKLFPLLAKKPLTLAEVCEDLHINRRGAEALLIMLVSDMFSKPFPVADVHFYSNIYHDWSPEKGRFLTQKSFESLEPGGRIIVHEMLYNNQKTGPLCVAANNMIMYYWQEGQQYSGQELSTMLKSAGFPILRLDRLLGTGVLLLVVSLHKIK